MEHECFSEAYRAEWEEYAAGVWAEMAAEDERTARLEDENARLRSCLAATERRMRLMLACGAPVLLVLVWVVLR